MHMGSQDSGGEKFELQGAKRCEKIMQYVILTANKRCIFADYVYLTRRQRGNNSITVKSPSICNQPAWTQILALPLTKCCDFNNFFFKKTFSVPQFFICKFMLIRVVCDSRVVARMKEKSQKAWLLGSPLNVGSFVTVCSCISSPTGSRLPFKWITNYCLSLGRVLFLSGQWLIECWEQRPWSPLLGRAELLHELRT